MICTLKLFEDCSKAKDINTENILILKEYLNNLQLIHKNIQSYRLPINLEGLNIDAEVIPRVKEIEKQLAQPEQKKSIFNFWR